MSHPVHQNPQLIYSLGTQVVILIDMEDRCGQILHPRGSVAEVVKAPLDLFHSYRVRFSDGSQAPAMPHELSMLALFKQEAIGRDAEALNDPKINPYYHRVIYRCVVGSRAFGLETGDSDTDLRGVFLPRAVEHWSIFGVSEQIDFPGTQEQYWELQKFLVMALKANPNILECLYSPLLVSATPLGRELIDLRSIFLSRLVYQTFNGYVLSQFKKMQADLRNQGQVKWKHVMHLLRLLISGIHVLKQGEMELRADAHRERLLAIRRGEIPWEQTEELRLELHRQFEQEHAATRLPERPNYERANAFLLKARQAAIEDALP